MARPDLQEVGKLAEALERAEELPRAELHGAGHVRGALEQVGAAHVAHEEEVAGQRAHRLIGARHVGDQKGEMFRRMSWRVHDGDLHLPHPEGRALAQQRSTRLRRVGVAPVGSPHAGEMEAGTGAVRQLPRAGHEIRVDVRLGHVGDAESLRVGNLKVLIDVPVGIDDQRFAAGGAAHQVAGLGELVVVEVSKEHPGVTPPR